MQQRTILRAATTVVVAGLALICLDLAVGPTAQADFVKPTPAVDADWLPPLWHPTPTELQALPAMDGEATTKGPGRRLHSQSVFVYDVDAAEVLYERAADNRRPVASLTKLVTALALSTETPDLTQVTCVDELFWPSRSGARSRMSTGECYVGWDLLGAALVASDNRAAYGLSVQSGLDYFAFIDRMDEVSSDLGMTQSTWADPSGLEDDNLSTARDMAKASLAVAHHPTLALAASARSWRTEKQVEIGVGPRTRDLLSTNRALARKDVEWLAAKTGYTDTARYCFTGVVRTESGRTLAVSLLGANRSRDRWADLDTVLRWTR